MGEIVLNRMFGGTYNENEIGHEIINLFKDDNGDNYIYMLSAGDYAERHFGKITDVILTSHLSKTCIEVLGVARELEPIVCIPNDYRCRTLDRSKETYELGCGPDFDKYSAIHKAQIDYIKKNNVKYGGVYVDQIFKNAGATQTEIYDFSVSLTFKANYFRKPKKPIFLVNTKPTNDCEFFIKKCVSPTSQTVYFSSDDNKETDDYRALSDIINDASLWEDENTSVRVSARCMTESEMTFTQIMKKEYDELSFSNMIAFFLEREKGVLGEFIKKVLKIRQAYDMSDASFRVEREKKNIDLFISTKDLAIVVENKIKSRINGVNTDTQLTQLDKYYEYTEKNYPDHQRYYYIFAPDYSHIEKELEQYDKSKRYTIIRYSSLYDFFNSPENTERYNGMATYYHEFLNSLKIHTTGKDESLYNFTLRRFWEMICLKRSNA